MRSWHIHISGRVQGVGFRPFICRLARTFHLDGTVQNGMDGVHVYLNAEEEIMAAFCQQIRQQAPTIALISTMNYQPVPRQNFSGFGIVPSDARGRARLLITPDLAMCDDCRHELHNQENRRYRYPFITCTHCGPRYSIMESLPFDRQQTSMRTFTMCETCEAEYADMNYVPDPEKSLSAKSSKHENVRSGTRYHAQTNSCQECGVQLTLHDLRNQKQVAIPLRKSGDTVDQVSRLLLAGHIVAVKGIGGYLLLADATSARVVRTLRSRKQRPAKPFALMYPNLTTAKQDVETSPKEEAELLSYRAPILLLRKKEQQHSGIALQHVAPGLRRLGVMLPYTPLFELIASAVNRPLIATSANLSGSPILYQDEEALENLPGIADYVLANNREIYLPQDDTVMQFSTAHQQAIILRRSRGLAPAFELREDSPILSQHCLAMGAQQKSSFALNAHGQLYLSQYLGELSSYPSRQAYGKTLDYLLGLCQAAPQVIITDQHPDYQATQLGQQMAKERHVSLSSVQHHRAHFGSVLAENHLLQSEEPVLGIVWDGTGWGEDQKVWGGEFFTFADRHMQRVAHLAYSPQRFGDKMAREPRLSLLCLAEGHPEFVEILRQKFSQQEWKLYRKMLEKPATVQTSSMGRLFDALASLLGLCDVNQYESQAAILLEQEAAAYLNGHSLNLADGYHFSIKSGKVEVPLLAILRDLQYHKPHDEIAARFHLGLVRCVEEVATIQKIQKLAFSGGVFQNALLNDLLAGYLSDNFDLYFHQQLSPNDESLPLGQIACHWLSQQAVRKDKEFQSETLNL